MTDYSDDQMKDFYRTLVGTISDASQRDRFTVEDFSAGTRQSLKRWFQGREGQKIDTIQATVTDEGEMAHLWSPLNRSVDAVRGNCVSLDGSQRYFDGTRVLYADDNRIVVRAQAQVFAYVSQ